ncbi:MAG: type II 3-dehydroquinate dehydratase [Atribacterota bacterium]|jgi:3-dehydroquinate dehydratase-2|nr:type II 3-dehydroquinate dehydratase [Atribacterota bacterium]
MIKLLLIFGPNINLMGSRDPSHYGDTPFDSLNQMILKYASDNKVDIDIFQSNYEGAIIDKIHEAKNWADGILINPGAYVHYSYAIRDAIAAVKIPTIDVHISNTYAREAFREKDVLAPVCQGIITGFGVNGIFLGIKGLFDIISKNK